jgi:extradiol dioxygenase family protein
VQAQGVRHFGAILPWSHWQALAERLVDAGCEFAAPPRITYAGTVSEQAKMLLRDPSGNLVEIKAYRDAPAVFADAAHA